MLKITFKDVGQGDSIIIEWEKNNETKFGLIDCNLHDNGNPILEFVKSQEIKEIEFVILSHPHYDHFSGLLELFSYCKENGVKINSFIHTCSSLPDYLKTAVKGQNASRAISSLFDFIFLNFEAMEMEVYSVQSSDSYYNLSNDYRFKFLSPSQRELLDVIKAGKYDFDEESPENNPKINLLSTVIKLEISEGYILLTSDAPKTSLFRIDTKLNNELDAPLVLGQSPHHGAVGNHNNTFWKKRKRAENTPIVFSVGKNHYGHVSKTVIDSFAENNYHLFSTNKVGGFATEEEKSISALLDVFSIEISNLESDLKGDKIFQFS